MHFTAIILYHPQNLMTVIAYHPSYITTIIIPWAEFNEKHITLSFVFDDDHIVPSPEFNDNDSISFSVFHDNHIIPSPEFNDNDTISYPVCIENHTRLKYFRNYWNYFENKINCKHVSKIKMHKTRAHIFAKLFLTLNWNCAKKCIVIV